MKRLAILLAIFILVSFFAAFDFIYLAQKNLQERRGIVYENNLYGFSITLPNSWKGFEVGNKNWEGWKVDGSANGPSYKGVEIIIKNPKTTAKQAWQDIPVMVFEKNIWNLVEQEKISVSAAPIGPVKIGENSKYIFATPPRWYGFADAIGWEEAVEAVKTFKAFDK